MKIFSNILILLLVSAGCAAQSDTVLVEKQKGFLFLSSYNYLYDYDGVHSRPLGFHDFFFPSDCANVKCFLDSNMSIIFKGGIRVDSISNNRKLLKRRASVVSCIDTSSCYAFDKFYVIPVVVDYKIYEDNWPYVCRRNYFELQVLKGAKLRFEYLHSAIKPLQIIPIGISRKTK